jgi:hypothetical protein
MDEGCLCTYLGKFYWRPAAMSPTEAARMHGDDWAEFLSTQQTEQVRVDTNRTNKKSLARFAGAKLAVSEIIRIWTTSPPTRGMIELRMVFHTRHPQEGVCVDETNIMHLHTVGVPPSLPAHLFIVGAFKVRAFMWVEHDEVHHAVHLGQQVQQSPRIILCRSAAAQCRGCRMV